jgi:hypothetical protein
LVLLPLALRSARVDELNLERNGRSASPSLFHYGLLVLIVICPCQGRVGAIQLALPRSRSM